MAGCISNGRRLMHVLNHASIDLLDKNICVFCNEGGVEVFICCKSNCRVALHAKCLPAGPKFDDLGNFYCPHCWYDHAANKRNELKKKVMMAKKALLSFLDEDVVTRVELVRTDEDGKSKVFYAEDRISLGCADGQDTDDIDFQPSQHKGDCDQYEIALEGQAGADDGCRHCREEATLVDLRENSRNWETYDKTNKSEKDEIRVLEQKESFEAENPSCNKEEMLEMNAEVREESEPLNASNFGKHNSKDSLDIAFVKGTQEIVANSTDRAWMTDKGTMPHREQKVSDTGSSVSESSDSDSEVISGRKWRGKRKVQKKSHLQNTASARISLLLENTIDKNEQVTSSKTRKQSRRLKKPVHDGSKNGTSLIFRRNKLLWTAEEETVLKEGVSRFSRENQTIPWTRILEFGRHVFDKTRTPIDLKDKWRNISRRKG